MASVTDKFLYAEPDWTGTIGAGGVADSSVETIPLASATGLTNGKVYVVTIDRVNSGGTATAPKKEVVVGLLSGTDLTNCVRGFEGTAQAHDAGAVVEIIFTAGQWDRLIEGLAAEHDVDGTHSDVTLDNLQINDTTKDHQYVLAVNELTADRTITLPLLTANDTFVFRNHNNVAINFNAPEGFLINGKIVPSVASNNLTVAIKGMDGNDPSATNPVYVRINDTIRSITSALSVVLNAGTNYFNSGSSELATKEIDYFVYVWHSSTNSTVGLGLARIPYGTIQTDFNTASDTNEKTLKVTAGLTSAATDPFVNIGRFAATLSAGAGYTWSVPTFTATNLIQRPIYETSWREWNPVLSASESMTYTSTSVYRARYRISDRVLYIQLGFTGTTGGTLSNMLYATLPMSLTNIPSPDALLIPAHIINAGVRVNGIADFTTVGKIQFRQEALGNFSAGTNSRGYFNGFYEI